MGLYDGILLCSDIDGTLVNSRGELSEENAAAIRRFQAEGGRFTLSTGRYPQHIKRFAPRLVPNALLICINGTMLYDVQQEQPVYTRTVGEEAWELIRFAQRECPYAHTLYLGQGVAGEFGYKREGNRFAVPAEVQPPWQKIVLCMPEARNAELKNALQARFDAQFDFELSWSEGLEIHAKGSGKGDAVRQMRRFYPDVHTVVAAGDYENDIAMLREADIAYAVQNALPSVKAVADRITVSNDEHALARIIEDLAAR